MPKGTLAIKLYHGNHEVIPFNQDIPPHFEPGDAVHGEAIGTFEKSVKLDRFLTYLKWRILDHGEVSSEKVAAKFDTLASGDRASKVFVGFFDITLPENPWTYHGELFQIEWLIEVDTGKKTSWFLGEDIRQSIPITILPTITGLR
jgi:hypothetical protein